MKNTIEKYKHTFLVLFLILLSILVVIVIIFIILYIKFIKKHDQVAYVLPIIGDLPTVRPFIASYDSEPIDFSTLFFQYTKLFIHLISCQICEKVNTEIKQKKVPKKLKSYLAWDPIFKFDRRVYPEIVTFVDFIIQQYSTLPLDKTRYNVLTSLQRINPEYKFYSTLFKFAAQYITIMNCNNDDVVNQAFDYIKYAQINDNEAQTAIFKVKVLPLPQKETITPFINTLAENYLKECWFRNEDEIQKCQNFLKTQR